MKIVTIVGTRPEIIKMAPVLAQMENNDIENILIHTGQHYDYEMSQQFFLDLELKKPEYNIEVGSNSHGKQTAAMIEKIEEVLEIEKPDIVLVQGDTNAVLAGALTASKMHVPVGHVEAGLRSYDKTMPEEINRQVADVCSAMFFVPTEESAINLLFENIDPHKIFITGNTIVDASIRHLKIAERKSNIISKLGVKGDLLTLTMHRAENVDDPKRLKNIVEVLLSLKDITVIFPVHPRTLKNLKKFGLYKKLESISYIKLIKPMGYLDFLLLLSKSKVVMTDSGGLQEEAITLNVPCITLRYNTERPETVTAGGNILVGAEKEKILDAFNKICNDHRIYNKMKNAKNPFGEGNSSDNILRSILDAKKSDKLKISIPEQIVDHEGRDLLEIDYDISVSQYEELNSGSKICMVFADNNPGFPHSDLNLKNKIIIVNKFRME